MARRSGTHACLRDGCEQDIGPEALRVATGPAVDRGEVDPGARPAPCQSPPFGLSCRQRPARIAASRAGVTQLAECQLPKLNVAGSNPVSRSNSPTAPPWFTASASQADWCGLESTSPLVPDQWGGPSPTHRARGRWAEPRREGTEARGRIGQMEQRRRRVRRHELRRAITAGRGGAPRAAVAPWEGARRRGDRAV